MNTDVFVCKTCGKSFVHIDKSGSITETAPPGFHPDEKRLESWSHANVNMNLCCLYHIEECNYRRGQNSIRKAITEILGGGKG